jgi:hypothetical protein
VNTITNGDREELRDQFAAAALTAFLAHIQPATAFGARPEKDVQGVEHDKIAMEAYRWADAMLKARSQP